MKTKETSSSHLAIWHEVKTARFVRAVTR